MVTYLIIAFLIVLFLLYRNSKRVYVSGLYYYPIKSCEGIQAQTVEFDSTGVKFDREYAIFNSNCEVVTQRQHPEMRNIKPYLILNDQGEPSSMQLSYNKITTKIDLAPTGDSFKYSLWDKEGLAYKLADDGNQFLSQVLGQDSFLAHTPQKRYYNDIEIKSKDRGQILIASEESLTFLQQSQKTTMDMSLFRPNIILANCQPFGEDQIKSIKVGKLNLRWDEKCARCQVPTINPSTLNFDKDYEPTNTLRKINGNGVKAYFGSFFNVITPGILSVGSKI